ncbi:VPS4-associated protein 1 [Kalaharituber pfeilii]|nr:VPS4-associated protein 1 [Kalaharituber pfeilii]
MAAPFQNIYCVRRVAEIDSKPCSICYKPTTVYLVTACQKDFFPVCQGHLVDKGFASPIAKSPLPPPSVEELERKRKEALEKEIELVKKEYEEKQKRKKEREKQIEKEKANNEQNTTGSKDKSKELGKESDSKVSEQAVPPDIKQDDAPKTYALHRDFYNMRLQRLRQQQAARKTRELLKTPGVFPAVPKGPIG